MNNPYDSFIRETDIDVASNRIPSIFLRPLRNAVCDWWRFVIFIACPPVAGIVTYFMMCLVVNEDKTVPLVFSILCGCAACCATSVTLSSFYARCKSSLFLHAISVCVVLFAVYVGLIVCAFAPEGLNRSFFVAAFDASEW
jgi:hypothetical protein